jgi:hypothetical protein
MFRIKIAMVKKNYILNLLCCIGNVYQNLPGRFGKFAKEIVVLEGDVGPVELRNGCS